MVRRIRVYPWLMAGTMWLVLLIDYSAPGVRDRLGKVKGTDFLQFYVAGSLVREGRTDLLYDFVPQHRLMQSLAGGSDDILYVPVQSPQVGLAFSPLAAHGYTIALGIWITVSVLMYALACWITWRRCDALRGYPVETLGCCAAFPGLYATVLHGQTSAVSALIVVVALLALQRDRRLAAGLAFGCLAFKPHWVAAAGAIFIVARDWRVVAGITISAASQLGAAWLAVGSDVMNAYWLLLRSLQRVGDLLEPRAGNTLRGLFAALVPSPQLALALYAITAVIAVFLAARIWRRETRFELRSSAIVLAMVLISPHAFEYDLVLLVPALFMLANWIAASPATRHTWPISSLLIVLFLAPLQIGLPDAIRLQFSVTAMAVLLILMYRVAEPDRRYSARNATSAFTFVARRAGIQAARRPFPALRRHREF
jgi:alpha-1,2-mannosyltransferase